MKKRDLLKTYQSLGTSGKDGCKGRLEAAIRPDILYLFGQGILKSDVYGNHD